MNKVVVSCKLHRAMVSLRRFLRDTVSEEESQNKWERFLQNLVLMVIVFIGYIVIGHIQNLPYADGWYYFFQHLIESIFHQVG